MCLSGCARQGVRDEPTMRRLLAAFGPDHLRVELQRPFLRHDRALNRGLASLARRLGVPCVATGNVHAHSRERARLQDAFVAIREHATLDASEPLRRGNHSHVLASPRAMAARFADHPDAVRETLRLAERLPFDLTQRPRLPLPGRRGRGGRPRARRRCAADALRRPLPASGTAAGTEALAAPRRGAAGHPQARPVGLLHPAPGPARARARGGGRGARGRTRRGRCCRRAAAAGRPCPRSSATSPASRTSTRSRTSSSSAASSTRS